MSTTLGRDVYAACHLTGSFTLRSGQISTEYFDKYLFEGDPTLLRRVAEAMAELLPPCDVLAGMEMGAIPIATVMSQLTRIPAVFVRKQPKQYGTGKAAEGGPVSSTLTKETSPQPPDGRPYTDLCEACTSWHADVQQGSQSRRHAKGPSQGWSPLTDRVLSCNHSDYRFE